MVIRSSASCVTICKLREWREQRGLLQSDVAELACVSRQMLYAYENGIMYPSIAVANRLAYVLNCNVSDIFPCSLS